MLEVISKKIQSRTLMYSDVYHFGEKLFLTALTFIVHYIDSIHVALMRSVTIATRKYIYTLH